MAYDNYKKKGMSDLEKKSKLTALKGAHDMASKAMGDSMKHHQYKDSPELKKHTAEMSKESGIDFMNDAEHIEDPEGDGNVVGRHVSDEQRRDYEPHSVYDMPELDARLKRLLEMKAKIRK